MVDFADGGRPPTPWAQDVYARARARGHNHAHAVRVLAPAWLRIIWRCWHDGLAYDSDRHHTALLARTPPPSPPGPAASAPAS